MNVTVYEPAFPTDGVARLRNASPRVEVLDLPCFLLQMHLDRSQVAAMPLVAHSGMYMWTFAERGVGKHAPSHQALVSGA